MTAAGITHTTSRTWRALLPADRAYVVLPSRARPVLAADRDADVLEYLRRSLLARPPGTRLPGWVYESARRTLRLPGMWRAAPTWRPSPAARTGWEAGFAAWVRESGHRVLVLDHSHDPDHRAVLLLFAAGSSAPTVAIKVATTKEAEERLTAERDRLAALQHVALGELREGIPQLVDLPVESAATLLATTAMDGEPMFVGYYRNGHSRGPEAVRRDFHLAGSWLARLQAEPTGDPAPLDLPPGTAEAAHAHLADRPADRDVVASGLAAIRARLGAHRVAPRVVHGDFWAGNLIVRDGALRGVIDWERWEPAGSPVRDLGRFAVSYSLYLDRQTRPGAAVRGHAGLVAGSRSGGVGYAISGTGWYPGIVRGFLAGGLARLGLPASLGADVVLAELAAIAAESTNPDFARDLWLSFAALSREPR